MLYGWFMDQFICQLMLVPHMDYQSVVPKIVIINRDFILAAVQDVRLFLFYQRSDLTLLEVRH